MNISNINDLSPLIKLKEEQHFTFRRLECKDVPQLLPLMINQFLNYNPAFQILQITEQDIKSCFTQDLFNQIIQEKLSFGAFKNDMLVSVCLTYDLGSNDTQEDKQEILPTQKMQEIINMNDILLGKYADKKDIKQKQIAYMSHLATKSDYFNQQLALSCCFLSIQECSKYGFQQMITVAEHVGIVGIKINYSFTFNQQQNSFKNINESSYKFQKNIIIFISKQSIKNQTFILRLYCCKTIKGTLSILSSHPFDRIYLPIMECRQYLQKNSDKQLFNCCLSQKIDSKQLQEILKNRNDKQFLLYSRGPFLNLL